MADPIRQCHILFEQHLGNNREWTDEVRNLFSAMTNHISYVAQSRRELGRTDELQEIMSSISTLLHRRNHEQ